MKVRLHNTLTGKVQPFRRAQPQALRVRELFAQHVFGCLVSPWSRGCVRGGELLLHRQAELLFTIAGVDILEARMRISSTVAVIAEAPANNARAIMSVATTRTNTLRPVAVVFIVSCHLFVLTRGGLSLVPLT